MSVSQWREQTRRIDHLESEVGYLRSDVTNIKATLGGISDKLDVIRTQRPNLGVVFGGVTLATLLIGAILAPLYKTADGNAEALQYIQQSRWTRADHIRAEQEVRELIRQARAESELEFRELTEWQLRQDEILLDLERRKADR